MRRLSAPQWSELQIYQSRCQIPLPSGNIAHFMSLQYIPRGPLQTLRSRCLAPPSRARTQIRLYSDGVPTSSRRRIPIPRTTPSFPTIESCPPSTCSCRPIPSFPDGLEIDRETDLNGTMAPYYEQILVCTGRDDWPSKVEDSEGVEGPVMKSLREGLGPKGAAFDQTKPISLTACSVGTANGAEKGVGAYIMPSGRYVSSIGTSPTDMQAFLQKYVRAETEREIQGSEQVNEALILICGHGGRDQRCGIMGPLLRDEFEEKLASHTETPFTVLTTLGTTSSSSSADDTKPSARVGLISHIGGHKYAGNVIIYIPRTPAWRYHPLAGKGIWYGRVEPKHVEGLIDETIIGGRVVREMFRGGVGVGGEVLRL